MTENCKEIEKIIEKAQKLYFAGKTDEAERALSECVAAENPEYFRWLSFFQREAGKYDAARKNMERAIKLNSREAQYFVELGIIHYRMQREKDARFYFEEALALDAGNAEAHFNLALLERNAGNFRKAAEYLENARKTNPHNFLVLFNIGYSRFMLGEYEESEKALFAALKEDETNAETFFLLGSVYLKRKNFSRAREMFAQAVTLQNENYRYLTNFGIACHYLGEFDEAKKAFEKALQLNPQFREAKLNLAETHYKAGDYETALKLYDELVAENSADKTARFNRSLVLLKIGRYDEGLKEYENRLSEEQLNVLPEIPFWQGENPAGKKILVLDEQGAGDAIQFVRYLQPLKDAGANVILQTKKNLCSLFSKNELADEILCEIPSGEKIDYKIYLLSLPLHIGDFPMKKNKYLKGAEEVYLPFAASENLKIGVAWRGNKDNVYDNLRSIPLEKFSRIFRVRGVVFYSLQIDADEKEKEFLKKESVIDLSDKLETFEDTANIAERLDAIITVDTALAHLGGALGKPTWILAGEHDWRWGTEGEKTDWYESVLLFRKGHGNDWDEALAKATETLIKTVREKNEKKDLLVKYNAINELNEGRLKNAEALFKSYIENSNDFESFFWFGVLKKMQNDFAEAKKHFEEALALNPEHYETIENLATIALAESDFGKAKYYYEKILNARENADVYNNYGFVLSKLKKLDEAEPYFLKAIGLKKIAGYYLNAANNYFENEKYEEALKFYNEAIKLENISGAHVGKGLLLLTLGYFREGFREYAWTLENRNFPANYGKRWNGENLANKTIVIYSEQGLGDSIQFFRFLPKLKKRGARTVVLCPAALTKLFSSSEYADKAVTEWREQADFHVSMLDLPRVLNLEKAEDFALPPNLFSFDASKIEEEKKNVASDKLNVGIVWKTYSKAATAEERSVSEKEIKELFELENVDFYILQIDTPPEIENELSNEFDNIIFIKKNFYDLAHFVSALDLVISVDTVVLHIAANAGVETWGLINKFADWRWQRKTERSYLYPTVRLFRQKEYFTWGNVLNDVKEELRKKIALKKNETKRADGLTARDAERSAEKYIARGDYAAAREILEKALRNFPERNELFFKLGYVNQLLGENETAIYFYSELLRRDSFNLDALNNLGVALKDDGKYKEAEKFLKIAKEINPKNASALNNLGLVEEALGNFERAIQYYDSALEIKPNFRDALLNRANSLMFLYRFDEALADLEKITRVNPADVGANYNKGIVYLFKGDYAEGFRFYEWRKKRPECLKRNFTKPQLENFTDIEGKRILVYDEQGYGDTIQFCRFVRKLKERGATVILQTHAALAPLLSECSDVDVAIPRVSLGDPKDAEYDFHIPLLSLPAFFGIKNESELIQKMPYVNVNMELKEKYRKTLFHGEKIKVGLVWEGKKPIFNEHRSTSLQAYSEFVKAFDFEFYSLQQENVAKRNRELMQKLGVIDLSEHLHNFDQTAAIVSNLDFVVTIDTSVAHLCGALNKPTYVLLSRKADWRWATGERTPWYSSHRLIRQKKLGDWDYVVKKLIREINLSETDFKSIN